MVNYLVVNFLDGVTFDFEGVINQKNVTEAQQFSNYVDLIKDTTAYLKKLSPGFQVGGGEQFW